MSLVSNFIGNISNISVNGVQTPQSFDLNDAAFDQLLEKQIAMNITEPQFIGEFGTPAGFEIDGVSPIMENGNIIENFPVKTDINDITTSETLTFFSSLLDNKENTESEIFNFAKKQATNLYNKYSKSVVTDISEFVQDIKNII